MSSRLIKKVCSALLTRKLIEKAWLSKPSLDVLVNLANSGPMLNIRVHNLLTTCVLDTGSTYTLVPFHIWQKFKINSNQLNTSVQFNINSASHSNKDAVLGQIKLDLSICNIDGNEQLVTQNCLILRPNLELQFVLLGNDFLYDNSVNISYSRSEDQPLISINFEKVPLLNDNQKAQSFYSNSFLVNSCSTNEAHEYSSAPTNTESVPSPSDDQQQAAKLFHLDPDTEMININSFLQDCQLV